MEDLRSAKFSAGPAVSLMKLTSILVPLDHSLSCSGAAVFVLLRSLAPTVAHSRRKE